VFYAVSTDHGASWTETRLYADDPNDPNDVEALDDNESLDGPREYIGIAYDPYRDWIWTSYTGTDPNELDTWKDVIYSNRVDPNSP
jgi:hypothetical protein